MQNAWSFHFVKMLRHWLKVCPRKTFGQMFQYGLSIPVCKVNIKFWKKENIFKNEIMQVLNCLPRKVILSSFIFSISCGSKRRCRPSIRRKNAGSILSGWFVAPIKITPLNRVWTSSRNWALSMLAALLSPEVLKGYFHYYLLPLCNLKFVSSHQDE